MKTFDIHTLKGLRSAEKYQQYLNKKYDNVDVILVGVDKVSISGTKND
jgi:hypothetical protein